jgi:hypothetical protein
MRVSAFGPALIAGLRNGPTAAAGETDSATSSRIEGDVESARYRLLALSAKLMLSSRLSGGARPRLPVMVVPLLPAAARSASASAAAARAALLSCPLQMRKRKDSCKQYGYIDNMSQGTRSGTNIDAASRKWPASGS